MRALVACLALLALPSPVAAQSFNCRYARTADEVLICQNARLSALDERMADIYSRLRNDLGSLERAALEAEQTRWLRSRKLCGRDAACIADAYRERIRRLRR